jgi:hypothetical protein
LVVPTLNRVGLIIIVIIIIIIIVIIIVIVIVIVIVIIDVEVAMGVVRRRIIGASTSAAARNEGHGNDQ